jgi:hypothetical protein
MKSIQQMKGLSIGLDLMITQYELTLRRRSSHPLMKSDKKISNNLITEVV